MLGIPTTVLTTEHHQQLDERETFASLSMTKQRKPGREKLNDKLREASELLMKDKKEGKTYGSSIAGPQVEGMTLNGSEFVEEIEP
jgi:hypothetical protein